MSKGSTDGEQSKESQTHLFLDLTIGHAHDLQHYNYSNSEH